MAIRPCAVEEMVSNGAAFGGEFSGARVLVTGHTGFKGAWLTEWLLQLGAEVGGFSLGVPTVPALSDALQLSTRVRDWHADICDGPVIRAAVAEFRPQFVFHLAAQPLVRASYAEPVSTFQTNVIGTVQVLDAVRSLPDRCTVICVTTDKCYENREWLYGYREEDPLGGHDPYSASKAAAEIAIASYRRSFFSEGLHRLASARAGNVIGGGDWAVDRIVPDAVRALAAGRVVEVRNRAAVRPWQHVLEPLGGYLWLAALLQRGDPDVARALSGAFNFGPAVDSQRTVAALVDEILLHWPGTWRDLSENKAPHEAGRLQLAIDKAHALLGWRPVWGFAETVAMTVNWYRAAAARDGAAGIPALTRSQIQQYTSDASQSGLPWATGTSR